jgi:hypothetical protein
VPVTALFSAHPERYVGGLPVLPSLPEAAWINKPMVDSKKTMLVENIQVPAVGGDESGVDRLSRGMLENNICKQASQRRGNDTKFESEVSHCH